MQLIDDLVQPSDYYWHLIRSWQVQGRILAQKRGRDIGVSPPPPDRLTVLDYRVDMFPTRESYQYSELLSN